MRLQDKIVLITGAGSGLGRESALLFAREGATVVVTDVRSERAERVASEIGAAGGKAIGLQTDVRSEQAVAEAVDTAVDQFGRLDVMYANAGVGPVGFGSVRFEDLTEEDWDAVDAVNNKGVFFSVKQAARVMIPRRRGAVVVTVSAAAIATYPQFSSYAVSKAAAGQIVRSAAIDLGKYGIRVNGTCPCHGMSANFPLPLDAPVSGLSYEETRAAKKPGGWNSAESPIPLKLDRPPRLLDTAYQALYLASDESAYLSGALLPSADGGTLAKVAMNFDFFSETIEESTAGMRNQAG